MLQMAYILYVFGLCYGKTRRFQEHEIRWRSCFPSVEVDDDIGRRNTAMVVGSLFLLTVVEVIIYAMIFIFLHQHNISMQSLLPEQQCKKR